jgi:hypothetical protein
MKRLILALAVIGALVAIPSALAAGTLSGKWKTKISGDHALGGQLNGTWVIKFTPGHYSVTDQGKNVLKGVNSITGNKITFTDKSGAAKCSGTGHYKFKINGSKLTFTKVSDSSSCAGREGVLAHKFTKVG